MNASPPNGTATRILLVDEHLTRRESVDVLLHSEGFQTACASNRHEALDALKQGALDLVIMNMQGAEGIGTMIAIRAFAPDLRIIAMSEGPAADGFLPLAKSLGASGLLGDPLDHGKLLDAIHAVLAPDLHQVAC